MANYEQKDNTRIIDRWDWRKNEKSEHKIIFQTERASENLDIKDTIMPGNNVFTKHI